jgi:hypothetical protein
MVPVYRHKINRPCCTARSDPLWIDQRNSADYRSVSVKGCIGFESLMMHQRSSR